MKQPVVIDREMLYLLLNNATPYNTEGRFAIGMVDAMNAAQKALSNPFIPVSERLPKDEDLKDGLCDVMLPDGSILIEAEADSRFGMDYFRWNGLILEMKSVTHWRATEVV
jgi:hypothetical protein